MSQNEMTILGRIIDQLKKNRKLFYVVVPVCAVVFFLLMLCVPKTFTSTFSFTCESQEGLNNNYMLTLNNPEHYDLGLANTRSAVDRYSMGDILASPQFLATLFMEPVRTMEGDYEGTYADYLCLHSRKPFWSRAKDGLVRTLKGADKDTTSVSPISQPLMLSRRQAAVLAAMQHQIQYKFDHHTYITTVTVTTQDPLVSAQVAKYVQEHLQAYVGQYQQDKMQQMLGQLSVLVAQAHADYDEAVQQHAPDAAVKKQIYESFCRQQVVYQAQMIIHPSIMTIAEPVVSYKAGAPHRTMVTLILTAMVTILLALWVCRRELMEAI